MAKVFTAPFAQAPKTAVATVTAACATFTGTSPTNTVLLFTAGAEGAVLTRLSALPLATCTASCLMLFLSKDTGTTKYLIDSEVMAATTVNTTTVIPEVVFGNYAESIPMRLAAGDSLYVGNQVAGNVTFKAEYTEF